MQSEIKMDHRINDLLEMNCSMKVKNENKSPH